MSRGRPPGDHDDAHVSLAGLRRLSDETRLVASEPLGELAGAWQEVPESSYGVIQKGNDELGRFEPVEP